MFVKSLETIYLSEEGYDSEINENPIWDDVVRAVKKLNAVTYDGVILNGPNGSYMGIVGGREGEYVVAGINRSGNRFILADGKSSGKKIAINVGGQENEYADFEIASFEMVLKVAQTFFESGICDPLFKWNEK